MGSAIMRSLAVHEERSPISIGWLVPGWVHSSIRKQPTSTFVNGILIRGIPNGIDGLSRMFLVVGLIFISIGGGKLWPQLSFRRRAQRITGIVTDLRVDVVAGSDPHITYYPIVRFTTHDGREVETTAKTGTSPLSLETGKQVTILYDPADPTIVKLSGGMHHLGFFGLVFGIGLLSMGIGGLILFIGSGE